MTYDPGSSGALSYLSAAQEIAERGARSDVGPTRTVEPSVGAVSALSVVTDSQHPASARATTEEQR
jgi:hypothetical protein